MTWPRFSPHTRGCSVAICATKSPLEVFPAYAGMFLKSAKPPAVIPCFPRIRGDVPAYSQRLKARQRFSPHTRGCSAVTPIIPTIIEVFPAYAGMFPPGGALERHGQRFPRIRGDVPDRQTYEIYSTVFSPHTRGCSANASANGAKGILFSPHTRGCSCMIKTYHILSNVFPAYAGMFRTRNLQKHYSPRFPRIRGDVPN
mgnify:CR=1 FL=1